MALRVLGQAFVHSGLVMQRYMRAYTAMSVVAGVLFSVLMLFVLLPIGPGSVFFIGSLVMLAYLSGTIQLASGLAAELETGEAVLYLSTPLSRVSYTLSWLLSSLVLSVLLFLVAFIVPSLAISPALLAEGDLLVMASTIAGELLYYATALTLMALLLKKRTLVQAGSLGLFLVGPILLFIGLAVYDAVAPGSVSDELFLTLLGLFHPVVLAFEPAGGFNYVQSLAYSIPTSALLALAYLAYSHRRFEV